MKMDDFISAFNSSSFGNEHYNDYVYGHPLRKQV